VLEIQVRKKGKKKKIIPTYRFYTNKRILEMTRIFVPVIPGLTFEHFVKFDDEMHGVTMMNGEEDDSTSKEVLTKIPKLKIAKIKKCDFYFQWDAKKKKKVKNENKKHRKILSFSSFASNSTRTTSTATTTTATMTMSSSSSSSAPLFLAEEDKDRNDTNTTFEGEEDGFNSIIRRPRRLFFSPTKTAVTKPTYYYTLYAKGNILKYQTYVGLRQWWGFQCHCTCPEFIRAQNYTQHNGETKQYVCTHLHAALLSVIDTEGFVKDTTPPMTMTTTRAITASNSSSLSYDESDAFNNKDNNDNGDNNNNNTDIIMIPGLTTQHFVNGNVLHGGKCYYPPILKRAHIDTYGCFHFVWEIIGGADAEKSYELGAHGDIQRVMGGDNNMCIVINDDTNYDTHVEEDNDYNHNYNDNNNYNAAIENNITTCLNNWWGFDTYCTCSNYKEQYHRRLRDEERQKDNSFNSFFESKRQNYVCKHLAIALESVIDPKAQVLFELSNKY